MTNFSRNLKAAVPFIVLILALLSVLPFSGATFASEASPKIVFKEEVHDFGTVKSGPELKHNFSFTNKGGGLLTIQQIQTSCGCTVAKVEKKSYKPGESGKIHVTFSTQGRTGPQKKTITVESNDPQSPRKQLELVCSIVGK